MGTRLCVLLAPCRWLRTVGAQGGPSCNRRGSCDEQVRLDQVVLDGSEVYQNWDPAGLSKHLPCAPPFPGLRTLPSWTRSPLPLPLPRGSPTRLTQSRRPHPEGLAQADHPGRRPCFIALRCSSRTLEVSLQCGSTLTAPLSCPNGRGPPSPPFPRRPKATGSGAVGLKLTNNQSCLPVRASNSQGALHFVTHFSQLSPGASERSRSAFSQRQTLQKVRMRTWSISFSSQNSQHIRMLFWGLLLKLKFEE